MLVNIPYMEHLGECPWWCDYNNHDTCSWQPGVMIMVQWSFMLEDDQPWYNDNGDYDDAW